MEKEYTQALLDAYRHESESLSDIEKMVLWLAASKLYDRPNIGAEDFIEVSARDVTSVIGQSLEMTDYDLEAAVGQLYNRTVVIETEESTFLRWIQSMSPSDETHPVAMRFSKEALPYMAWLREQIETGAGIPLVGSER